MSAKTVLLIAVGGFLLVWLLLYLSTPGEAPEPGEDSRLRRPERLRSPVPGPSGIACDPAHGRLFVVGDRGHVAEVDLEGRERSRRRVKGDLEDVAVHPSGKLLILDETAAELFLYDYDREQEERRWTLDVAGLLGGTPAPLLKDGFEGLAFRADPPGGPAGLLYLVHQHRPPLVVVAAFDPRQEASRLGRESVRARWNLEGYRDAKAITYVPSLDRFLLVSDAEDRLVVLRADGRIERDLPLPGEQQEGVCLDGEGTLWVADDRARRLLRFPGALEALRSGSAR